MQIESVNFPIRENIKDRWTAERCMVMVSPTTAQKCSNNTQELALLRFPRHKDRRSTTTSLKKRLQGIPDDGIGDDSKPRISLSQPRSRMTNHERSTFCFSSTESIATALSAATALRPRRIFTHSPTTRPILPSLKRRPRMSAGFTIPPGDMPKRLQVSTTRLAARP